METDKDFLIDMLSARQKEIFNLKENGLSERQIAIKLGIKRGTVRINLDRIEKKWATPIDKIQRNYDIIKRKKKIK